LFIVIDDLRPELGCYNQSNIHTPHIDKLASGGLIFARAYVQYSICAPSRNSFMTGRRPDTTRVWNFADHFREPLVPGRESQGLWPGANTTQPQKATGGPDWK
jgi:iduronate 2-sulfatase